MPSLLLQPLVENAIEHGIAPMSRPGVVIIARPARRAVALDGGAGQRRGAQRGRAGGVAEGDRPVEHARRGCDTSTAPHHRFEFVRPGTAAACRSGSCSPGTSETALPQRRRRWRRRMTIRTLVADDEPLARERIVTLLQEEPDVEVVGECAGRRIRRSTPSAASRPTSSSSTSRCRPATASA